MYKTPRSQEDWRSLAREMLREVRQSPALSDRAPITEALIELVERPFVDLFVRHLQRAFELGIERGFRMSDEEYVAGLSPLQAHGEPPFRWRSLPKRPASSRASEPGRRHAKVTLNLLPYVAEGLSNEANRISVSMSHYVTLLFAKYKGIETPTKAGQQAEEERRRKGAEKVMRRAVERAHLEKVDQRREGNRFEGPLKRQREAVHRLLARKGS